MKWYNRIFDRFGHRRLMTHDEFVTQMRAEVAGGRLRVLEAREHDLLLEIVVHAVAFEKLWTQSPAVKLELRHDLTKALARRLTAPLMSYKIVQQNKNTPHSTNRTREVELMEMP